MEHHARGRRSWIKTRLLTCVDRSALWLAETKLAAGQCNRSVASISNRLGPGRVIQIGPLIARICIHDRKCLYVYRVYMCCVFSLYVYSVYRYSSTDELGRPSKPDDGDATASKSTDVAGCSLKQVHNDIPACAADLPCLDNPGVKGPCMEGQVKYPEEGSYGR